MKKFILSLMLAVLTAGAVTAGQNVSITEARIYINPGHGSWGPNDRNMATINHNTGDTTGFYESNTNLWKGLKLRQILIDWGMPAENICMSRVKNGPYPYVSGDETYNRALSEIARECNSFNSDYFISIHSDAGYQNHTLLIHKGYTNPAEDSDMHYGGDNCVYDKDGWHTHYGSYTEPEGGGNTYGSKELMQICSDMAHTTWAYLTTNGIDVMNSAYMQPGRDPYIVGDYTFYKGWKTPAEKISSGNSGYTGYLGVLNRNITPGFLSEGYSHQYYPATHRALNPDYCGQEGMRYARGIAEWFGWEKDTKGYIMGSVKDLHTHLEHQYYNYAEGSIDQWMPVNNAEVVLYKGGVEIAKYQGDNEWNGVFVFEKLEPGDDYTIKAVAPGYKSNFELDEEYGRETETYSVVANETTYPVIYLEASDYEPYPCYNYSDPEQDKWLGVSNSYEMRKDFDNKTLAQLEGKTIRRELAHGDSIYALALDTDNTPHIYCYNAKTQELFFELSTEGVGAADDENEILPVSDIAFTSDSILVACNSVKTRYNLDGGTFRVYAWERDETTRSPKGSPKEWFTSKTTQTSGNFNDAVTGETFTVSGRYEKCTVVTTAETVNSPGKIRLAIFTLTRKGLVNSVFNKNDDVTKSVVGENYKLCVSPYDDASIILDGSGIALSEYALNESNAGIYNLKGTLSTEIMPAAVNGATFFKYAHHVLMAVPKTDADGKNVGVALYDVNGGLDKACLIETTNTELTAADAAHLYVSSHVEDADITLYLNKDNTVSRFTTQDCEQVYYNNVYAYDLKVVADGDNYKFSFVANEDCLNGGSLLFYDAASGDLVGEIVLDNVVAGPNEKIVAATDLPGEANQELNWSVKVASKNVTHILPLLEKGDYALNRAYVTVDNSPKSENFGKIYVSNYTGLSKADNGILVYDQSFNSLNDAAYHGGVTFAKNGAIVTDKNGNVYVADAGAVNSGLWIAAADQLDTNFFQFFGGVRTDGIFFQNGVEVGGAVSSISFYGEGANTKMYVYAKNSSGKYVVNVYNVGNEDGTYKTYWAETPSKTIELPSGMTEDVTLCAVEQGVWLSQTVALATNNKKDSPALMFIDNNGNVTFNSADVADSSLFELNQGSAIALSNDLNTIVVNGEGGVLQFFNVEWNETTPILTHKYSYEHGIGINSKLNKDGICIEQMSFDYAGRLVASGHYLGVFTIPTENNVCETPARNSVIKGVAKVSIENVEAADAVIEWYNLQGVRVAKPEKGVYIKKQGTKATKVIL